ncbi:MULTISPECIES: VRR-NUC domain-containing protein [unclassified Pseudomonas]|uniref:VRR-NUC domain-containing protein n=1 Tax=unclassified Pseudomonas TaxID=196821 RepID=UPI000BCF637B|nr:MULTISPECIES: VRR-NUC domain-containing protein [unclassified Pseudomonas]PVZ20022.1 VRR-NUC domain-containing protein [Pseudomonas sp. URIL14HWK12:I12]PVZ27088.1 VRR-NUC domain-containing protein [Pseudomonas sp. URIL14HWK12:I10]PVZ37977.1 VRR-NUC domain-containing protein [Pseudomonas sp. URIL14HWK12:I11]SNZ04926.1 VRR-NUC domain-containing protein [Pseudomonas sp. URIL14HWK12:I9]
MPNVNPLDDPFYYLVNFRTALAWLAERYADLLDAPEQAFIEVFGALPQPSQALLVRLVMRKGEHFRHSRLAYPEIGCPASAAQPLLALGWLCTRQPLSAAELCTQLTKPELAQRFQAEGLKAAWRKPEQLAWLQARYPQAQPFEQWCQALGPLYSLRVKALCERLRLMFFGNLHQDWSQFVLVDLGLHRFETVALAPESRALACREDIEVALALHALREQLDAGEPLDALEAEVAAVSTCNAWLDGRRQKLLFLMGQAAERQGLSEQAERLYRQCHWPQARWRLLRVLEVAGRFVEALALWEQAHAAPRNAAEAQALPRMLPRLLRGLGRPGPRRKPPAKPELLHLALPPSASVERAVGQALETDDAPVLYLENALFNSLFGLLCWPAIFAPLPGAFFHRFQHGPADLNQPDFYARRQALFDACLAELDDGRYRATILARFEEKYGLSTPFVYWGALSPALLELALACIPAQHLRCCFERLLQDIAANRTGMPDLIQFWPAERRYRMVEVKGPGDRLQDNQLRWAAFCAEQGMPLQVCHVTWQAEAAA